MWNELFFSAPQLKRDPLGSIDPVRTASLIAIVSSSLVACAPGRTPKELLGVWGIGRLPPDAPAACANVSIEYRSDGTVLIRSGPQTVTATYSTTAAGKGFLLNGPLSNPTASPIARDVPRNTSSIISCARRTSRSAMIR